MDERSLRVTPRPALDEVRELSQDMAAGTVRPSADEVMRIALRALQESETIVARHKAELDTAAGRSVLYCMDRDLAVVMLASRNETEGAVIRTTDTARELQMTGNGWRELPVT